MSLQPNQPSINTNQQDVQSIYVDIHKFRIKTAIAIFATIGILVIGILVALGFMLKYSMSFYNIVSSGQDSLCNFYTCSNSDECGKYPKIIFPDGTEKCLTD